MRNYQRIEIIKNDVASKFLSKNKDKQCDIWLAYLDKKLTFPFKAIIQMSEGYYLHENDVINVKQIVGFEDLYGVLLEVKKGRKKYVFPLCDIEVVEKQSKNRFIIEAFLEWWTEYYI